MNFKNIPFGTPERFNVVVEIPKGSELKYEYDEKLDAIVLEWVFTGGFHFPFNYGYIPQTRGGDGDHLDAFILNDKPFAIGTVLECRPVGIIELLDRGEKDDKILAVPVVDVTCQKYQSMKDLPQNYQVIFRDFFKELGVQKNKTIEIKGFHDKDRAIEELEKSRT